MPNKLVPFDPSREKFPPSMTRVATIPKPYTAVSFFAGCGSSSLGYRIAGYKILFANEFIDIAADTYAANAGKGTILDRSDIRKLTPQQVLKAIGLKRGELDLMDGSPPCKSFSTSGTRHNKWNEEVEYSEGVKQRVDDLFDEYIRLVKGIMPKVFVAENVEGLAVGKALGFLNEIISGFEAAGYVVDSRIVDAADLGAPQQRRRLITIGVRKDIYRKLGLKAVPFPKPQRKIVTVRDVLPHIVRVRRAHSIKTRFEPSDVPANTIMASDHTVTLTAIFSSGGWIEDSNGERRKYTIPELKVLSCVPKDFKLLGEYAQQWERLGRAHLPISTYHIGKALRDQVLHPLAQLSKRNA